MSIKVQLAELCANRNLPMAEYRKLSSYILMEKESDIIEKLESFHLPEITKLICGSDILILNSWALKYEKIRPLYCKTEEIDVIQVISDCKTVTIFENDILCFADMKILCIFKKYFEDLIERQNIKRKEKTTLTKKISGAKKKIEEENSLETIDNISGDKELGAQTVVKFFDDEKKLEELKMELSKIDKDIRRYKKYIDKIYEYEGKIRKVDSDDNREKAYRLLNDVKIFSEEEFLMQIINTGVCSDEYCFKFHDEGFVSRVLDCLNKEKFKHYAIPVLLTLHEEDVISLDNVLVNDFINQHPERLCDYLIGNTLQTIENLENTKLELLIEQALKKEIVDMENKKVVFFSKFWNTIIECNIWIWIIDKMNSIIDNENINIAISCLMMNLQGRAAKSLAEALFCISKSEINISIIEIISILMDRNRSSEKDAIIELMQLMEQSSRKVQRRLNISERKCRSQVQELFSSIYLPMEQLEELAINLKLTKGDIKASLVAIQLINIVISLREGLETLDLQPLVNMDDWKYQNEVKFDPNIHRVIAESDSSYDMVRLKSLGFCYRNDDGELQQYNAHASMEVGLPISKEEIQKDYSKNTKWRHKKKGNASKHTIDKKAKKHISQKKGRTKHKKKKIRSKP